MRKIILFSFIQFMIVGILTFPPIGILAVEWLFLSAFIGFMINIIGFVFIYSK